MTAQQSDPSDPEARLLALGLVLPEPAAAAANYRPYLLDGNDLFVSGQLPMEKGALAFRGRLGETLELEDGIRAASLCALNLLAQARAACGRLARIERVIRLGGFVASTDDFIDQPRVINGASDLMVAVFGEKGAHARAAVGVNVLPLGAAVEIEALFRVSPATGTP